jgi:hypothetical protein
VSRRCGGGTTTVFVGVGIGVDGCYGTTNISLPLYTSYSKIGYCKFRNLCVHLLMRITDEHPECEF